MASNRSNNARQHSATYHSRRGGSNAQGSNASRKRFTPRKRTSESEDDGICDLCVQAIKIYALGCCDHPICYRCSGKMRVLCEELQCAVCRVEMKKVIYSKSKRQFHEANELKLLKYGKKNIWFTDEIVRSEYEKLFEHDCPVCPDHKPEVSFKKLESHMRNEHKLFYCNLCVAHNKNFTHECKTYSREDLAKHRRIGDEDDTSHKGHPLCEFCDERYLDNDTLLRHLRIDHYFCHFCDHDGKNEYYNDYAELRGHYKHAHYLCEEGDCKDEKFTSVFATELDLKGHRTAAHSQSMTKQQQKNERNIDLGFQYTNAPTRGGGRVPRSDQYGGGRGRGRGRGRGGAEGSETNDIELAKALSLSEQENAKSLNKNNDSKLQILYPRIDRGEKKKATKEEELPPPNLVHDFPNLGAAGPENTDTYLTIQEEQSKTDLNLEVRQVEQPKSTAASKLAAAAGRNVGKITQEDFPTLGTNNVSSQGQPVGKWGATSIATSVTKKSKAKIPQQPVSVNMPQSRFNKTNVNLENKDDFPTLGGKSSGLAPGIWGAAASTTGTTKKSKAKISQQPVSVNVPQSHFNKTNVNLENKNDFPTLEGKSSGLVPGQSAIWGPLSSSHTPATKKPKKKKAPNPTPQSKIPNQTTQNKITSAAISNSNILSNDETVSIRVGKHTMRLSSAKHNAEIDDIEKPVEVPGYSGATSVQTVSADTFSLINNTSRPNEIIHESTHAALQINDFPELGGAVGNRIKGIGSSKTPWLQGDKKSKKTLTLSDVGNDIAQSSTIENNLSTKVVTSPSFQSEKDFPAITKPPSISSYASNWQDGDKDIPVTDKAIQEQNFKSHESDFPSLNGAGGMNNRNTYPGKKNKKKKKNKSQQNASDLSKHFGAVTIDNSKNGTAHLDSLLQNGKSFELKSLSTILDKDDMFAPVANDVSTKTAGTEEKHEPKMSPEPDKESSSEDEEFINSRPSEDDINGRNMWLISAIQRLCGTEENFSQFKSCSGSFRQGILSADRYYEKCKILLGKRHFSFVFQELVDLLPDADKQEALMQIHNTPAPF